MSSPNRPNRGILISRCLFENICVSGGKKSQKHTGAFSAHPLDMRWGFVVEWLIRWNRVVGPFLKKEDTMQNLERPITAQEFNEVFAIMDEAFPDNEKRTREDQAALLEQNAYRIKTVKSQSGKIMAFLAYWQLDGYCFVEHLAVSKEMRGGGTGGALMKEFLQQSQPVVLEVEPPDNDIAARRIRFYERLGFHLNSFSYRQPPMRNGNAWLPLFIMSYPKPLSNSEFCAVKQQLYHTVYGVEQA